MQDSFFINEDSLGELAIDLVNKADDISQVFTSIDGKMTLLKQNMDCSAYDSLMNSYNEFRKNYSIVKNTIISYSDDLIAVINKSREGDHDVSLLIDNLTQSPLEEAKIIDQKMGGVNNGFNN